MSILVCKKCGAITNTVVCDYDFRKMEEGAIRCYAKLVDNKWMKGCGFDANESDNAFIKAYAMHLITGKPTENFLTKGEK